MPSMLGSTLSLERMTIEEQITILSIDFQEIDEPQTRLLRLEGNVVLGFISKLAASWCLHLHLSSWSKSTTLLSMDVNPFI